MQTRSVRSVRFVAAEQPPEVVSELRGTVSFDVTADPAETAKSYLDRVLALDAGGQVSFDIPSEPPPATAHRDTQESKLTDTRVVRFVEQRASIPVFGSHMVVEIGPDGSLVAVDAEVSVGLDIDATPTVEAAAALAAVAAFTGAPVAALTGPAPTLVFFQEDVDGDGTPDRWHLAWQFVDVPAAPADDDGHAHRPGRGHGRSPRLRVARFVYLVDAHDGAVLFHYSLTPRAGREPALPAVPIKCTGVDDAGVRQEFYGQAVDEGFELYDPLRKLRTVDLAGGDISTSLRRLPKDAIRHAAADFGEAHRPAVSAHVNVGRVLDFFRSVLMRDGVDDKGMEIVSLVNCVAKEDEEPPNWTNAIWWENRMWFGQRPDRAGRMRSVADCLALVGHEIVHGITERTSDLIYKRESGALNESFSDILGVIIANWFLVGPDAVERWDWEFGAEIGYDGKPMRDLSDPRRTGDPDHMDSYLKTREDEGGVHTNSNIHNKAAYLLLTGTDADGQRTVTPREAAILYYMCLVRLPQRATFARTLRGLLDMAKVYFSGDKAVQARKLAAIEAAYAKVGITLEA